MKAEFLKDFQKVFGIRLDEVLVKGLTKNPTCFVG